MLIGWRNPSQIIIECGICGEEYFHTIPVGLRIKKNKNFPEVWENFKTSNCPKCDGFEILNMNFPMEEEEAERSALTNKGSEIRALSQKSLNSRKALREMIKKVREDYTEG